MQKEVTMDEAAGMLAECNRIAREVDTLTLPAREALAKAKAEADAALAAVVGQSATLTVAMLDALQVHHAAHKAAFKTYLAALEALKQGG